MRKLFAIIAVIAALTIPSTAAAGNATQVSLQLDSVAPADPLLDSAKLALKELEDEPGIDVARYKLESAKIIGRFVDEREEQYRNLRATEVLYASAEAKRPGFGKGRNADAASIRSSETMSTDWYVIQVDQRQTHQNANGENWARVEHLPENAGVVLKVYARSPKHDSGRGRTSRGEEVSITYRLQEGAVTMRAKADAIVLSTFVSGTT